MRRRKRRISRWPSASSSGGVGALTGPALPQSLAILETLHWLYALYPGEEVILAAAQPARRAARAGEQRVVLDAGRPLGHVVGQREELPAHRDLGGVRPHRGQLRAKVGGGVDLGRHPLVRYAERQVVR